MGSQTPGNLLSNSDPIIDLRDIQGDILIGLQKDAEAFIFFAIDDVARFKNVLKALVDTGLIISADEAQNRENQIRALKAANDTTTRLPFLGMNVGFTVRGMSKLTGEDAAAMPGLDPSFIAGAGRRGPDLGDDVDKWIDPRFKSADMDGVMLVTGPSADTVSNHAAGVLAFFGSSVANGSYQEMGQVRSPERGHEHFGFLDGVSQPGVRGLTARRNSNDSNQGLPGQDLLWPGEFVFGYPGQKTPTDELPATPADKGPQKEPPAKWMKNGSFMVWRRLEQQVLAFRDVLNKEASRLRMDPGLLRARIVGRWPSGAPVVLTPLKDDPALGSNEEINNGFEFKKDDPDQRRCPYAAHIRKTYPRDDLNDAPGFPSLKGKSGEASVQTRRLRRAGIPFGPEVNEKEESVGKEKSRGLMFVCYQTSIQNQFEFVQHNWANSPGFVFGKKNPNDGSEVTPGHDLIIGQPAPREIQEPVPNFPDGKVRSSLTNIPQFVVSTGAGYFFMPASSALRVGLAEMSRAG